MIELYHEIEDYFSSSISEESLDFNGNATAYLTALSVAELNIVYVKGARASLGEVFTWAQQFYDEHQAPFSVIVPKEFDSARSNGDYCLSDESTAMHCNLDEFHQSPVISDERIKIRKANEDLLDWTLPLIGAYEADESHGPIYASMHKKALDQGCHLLHFVLLVENKPVSALTLIMTNDLARIDDVGTLPSFQNQGYAGLLMQHALNVAHGMGAKHCFLEASRSGFKLCQNLGFKVLFENNIYKCELENLSIPM